MTAPLLAVEKFRYGRSPWRIVYTPTGLELPHARFDRKRDAVATLDKLLAAADWTRYPDFTAEDKHARRAVVVASRRAADGGGGGGVKTKAPFPWFGGKSTVAAEVWSRFGKVQNYVEPFFGSGAVLLGRPDWQPGATETVNDLDGLLCNAWRGIQFAPDETARYADWPVSECVPSGTMIGTPDGDLPIETIRPGMIVWGERNGKIVPARVIATKKDKASEFMDIGPLQITNNHPVWTKENGYCKASILESGNHIAVANWPENKLDLFVIYSIHEQSSMDYLYASRSANQSSEVCGNNVPRQEALQRTLTTSHDRLQNIPRLLDSINNPCWIPSVVSRNRTRIWRWLERFRETVDCSLSTFCNANQSHRWRRWYARIGYVSGIAKKIIGYATRSAISSWSSLSYVRQTAYTRSHRKNTGRIIYAAAYAGIPRKTFGETHREKTQPRTLREDWRIKTRQEINRGTQEKNISIGNGSESRCLRRNWNIIPFNNSGSSFSGRQRRFNKSSYSEGIPLQRKSLSFPVTVYNLQTTTENYFAERILVHNCDLHARHLWLIGKREDITARLMADPEWCDPKAAGWWIWGLCSWIGSGWCSGEGPWRAVDGQLVEVRTGGVKCQLPHLGNRGQGINRQRPHLGNRGQGVNRQLPHLGDRGEFIRAWFADLSARLRDVRVCCGDWTRVLGPSPTTKIGLTSIFFDPPYPAEADRDGNIYALEDLAVGHAVQQWAIEHGDDPRLRIALCGYLPQLQMPAGWTAYPWKAAGGYGRRVGGKGLANRHREVIWFSPHCLSAQQGSLLAELSL